MEEHIINTNNENTEEQEAAVPSMYTEEQLKAVFAEGQKSGFISAIKQVRSEINDYLSDLISSAKNKT